MAVRLSFRISETKVDLKVSGVMLAGYCFGELFTRYNAEKRKNILAIIGVSCIVLFIALRFANVYGDLLPWAPQKNTVYTILSFINTTKYPPSLLFILMTLGPAILFLSFVDKPLNTLSKPFTVYGRVPMFYYILHFYFIHLAFVIFATAKGFSLKEAFNGGIINPLPGFGYPLIIVYLVWLTIVALLYPLCKKYDLYKAANRQKWWLSYL